MRTLAKIIASMGRLVFHLKPLDVRPAERRIPVRGDMVTCRSSAVPHPYAPGYCDDANEVPNG